MLNNKKEDNSFTKTRKKLKFLDIKRYPRLGTKLISKDLDLGSHSFDKVIKLLLDYKRKYGVVDIPVKLKEDFILKYKILQIHNTKKIPFYYRYENQELIIGDGFELIKPLEKLMLEIGISIPTDITDDEIEAYEYNEIIRARNYGRKTYNCLLDYQYFNNWLMGKVNKNKDFDNLINLYNTDKLGFYGACIKSRLYNDGFQYQLNTHMLTLKFQTNDYDNTYKRYMAGIRNLKLFKKDVDKKIDKIRLNNYDLKTESKSIHYVFEENFNLSNDFMDSRFENSYSNSGGSAASYGHFGSLGKEITFYYNYYCNSDKKNDSSSLFHEFGHFINETLIDDTSYQKTLKILTSLLIKDYKLAFKQRRSLRYYRYRKYYKHVSPPLNILGKKNPRIYDDTYSNELFAEIVCDVMMSEVKKSKTMPMDRKAKKLDTMFPHTNYLVRSILKGKGVNKYKQFKK